MATLTTVRVTGAVLLPDGSSNDESYVSFHLDGFDTDYISDTTFIPDVVKSFLDSDGNLDADLWPNTRSDRGRLYSVRLGVSNGFDVSEYDMGKILVPIIGPFDLNDLLPQ